MCVELCTKHDMHVVSYYVLNLTDAGGELLAAVSVVWAPVKDTHCRNDSDLHCFDN